MQGVFVPQRKKLYSCKKHHDFSSFYYFPLINNYYLKRIKLTTSLIEDASGSVLEIGFGSGIMFYQLKDKFSNLFGLCTCEDTALIQRGLQSDNVNAILSRGDAHNIPFKDKSLDCVIGMSVFEHFVNLEQPFKEVKRVLKDDGIFICSFPVKNVIMSCWFKLVRFDEKKEHPSGSKYMLKMLKENFNVERILKFPDFLKVDNCFYMACRCKKR